jgi:hypothetical protein
MARQRVEPVNRDHIPQPKNKAMSTEIKVTPEAPQSEPEKKVTTTTETEQTVPTSPGEALVKTTETETHTEK